MLKHHEFRAKPGKMKELIALYKELAARADVVVPDAPHRVYREAVGERARGARRTPRRHRRVGRQDLDASGDRTRRALRGQDH